MNMSQYLERQCKKPKKTKGVRADNSSITLQKLVLIKPESSPVCITALS